jgi:hypothetical protein
MMEAEILLPVRCPVCQQEALTEYRMGVISDAFQSGQIRLYANCHLAGWDASYVELKQIREYLDATWASAVAEACQEIDRELADSNPVFIHTGAHSSRFHARPQIAKIG